MAIDDAEKRRSISGIMVPLVPGVTPNVAKDSQWRQQAGWSYSGISVPPPGGAAFTLYYYLAANGGLG